MNVYECVTSLLAVRQFQEKPLSRETIQRILEAGRLTGSSMNRQPWHFIVIQDREMLGKLGILATTGPYTAQAAMAIVVVVEKTGSASSDASRAIQSMLITAWGEGVGSNWVGSPSLSEAKLLLGIPEELEVYALLPFGYPVEKIGKGKKKRKSLAEVVHSERFGAAWE
jgi:nitroreductase